METLDHRVEICVRSLVPTKLRTANVRARKKMKVRRLIIVDDSNTEGSVVASQGRLTSAEWAELEADVARTKRKYLREKHSAFRVEIFSSVGGRHFKES